MSTICTMLRVCLDRLLYLFCALFVHSFLCASCTFLGHFVHLVFACVLQGCVYFFEISAVAGVAEHERGGTVRHGGNHGIAGESSEQIHDTYLGSVVCVCVCVCVFDLGEGMLRISLVHSYPALFFLPRRSLLIRFFAIERVAL